MEQHNPWQILDETQIYDNNWIGLTEYQVINPSGGKGIYGKVHFKNFAIGVIPLDEAYNTWLVGQYRFPLNAYSWEIPEGGGHLHESPLVGAKRELLEETGFTATNWLEIQQMHLSNSVSDELSIIYVATGLTAGESQPEETEQLTIRKLPFEEAFQMVLSGEITDSMSVAGLLKLHFLIQQGSI